MPEFGKQTVKFSSSPRPWQRQPGEAAPDFHAFVVYLRFKGRRSLRTVAAQTGRSLSSLRRLSARFDWPTRVHTFEERLAEATQDAVDSEIRISAEIEKSRLENLRRDEFRLAQDVLRASDRWLKLASNPRRRLVPLAQILRLIELSSRLARLAAGMPTGDEKTRSRSEPPGYWTGPSVEEALERIYGSSSPAASTTPDPVPQSECHAASKRSEGRRTPHSALTTPPEKPWPPPDDKRDLIPHALVMGPHGLLCLQRIESNADAP